MADQPFQLYEAVVLDGAPDGALPGHIEVSIPELFGETPVLVTPMFPSWHSGGWQSTPGSVNPDDPAGFVRVVVARLAENSFRWMGTSQAWELVAGTPGSAGARSGDGRHAVRMSDDEGVVLESQAGNQLVVAADGTVTVKGTSKVTIAGTLIWMGDGTVAPLERYILPSALFPALVNALAEVITIGAAIPTLTAVPTPNCAALSAALTASLVAGPPYLSTRIFGS